MAGHNVEEPKQAESDSWLSSIRSVTDGAVLHFGSNIVKNGVAFVLSLILTNVLGANLYGFYTFARRIVSEVQKFTNLGTDIAITRLISSNLDDRAARNRAFTMAYATSAVVSTLGAAVLFVAAPVVSSYTLADPTFTRGLQAFAIAVPFISLAKLGINSFRGLEMPVHQNALRIVVRLSRLGIISAAVLGGYMLMGAVVGFALASAFAFVLVTIVVVRRTDLRPTADISGGELKEFYNYSLPLSGSKAGSLLYNQVDVFMVGIFLSSAEVGIYSISMLLAGVILLPLSGFNQLFPPVASRLYSEGDMEMLQSVFTTVTRWTITATLFIGSVLVIYRREALVLFGEEFTAGTMVLTLFVVGKAVVAFSGPSNDLLMMTDHQYVVMLNHWTFGVLNVALNYVLIMEYGFIGAAIATAGINAVLNVLRVLEVWYFEGMIPYSVRLWKPLTAAVGAVAVMYGATFVLSGVVLLAVGSLLGGLVYVGALLLFGIEARDKRMLNDYYSLLD
ncbi:flippase [Halosimplex aquaticum]|uniref:Flippase n=1 Tax=Halosimplex aquaticum TaxID=3026162 RepID=A0ABD5XZZ6_9EURY|nr:flippase [Halosimplex aquaticum]